MQRLGAPVPSIEGFGLFAPPQARARAPVPRGDARPLSPPERRVLEPRDAHAALGRAAGWPIGALRGGTLRWWMVAVSLAVHLLILAFLLHQVPDAHPPQTMLPPVEMVYEPDSKDLGPGRGAPPTADQEPIVNVPLGVAPNPDMPDDLPPPPPIPAPDAAPVPQHRAAGNPHGRGRRSGGTSSPFSHPMDLSFGPGSAGAPVSRRGRVGGPVDLSLGPIAQQKAFSTQDRSAMIEGATGNYAALLEPWVYRRWKYPITAAMHGEQGLTKLHVRADKDGNILSLSLEGPSGSVALDQAAEDVFRHTRLPKPTPDMLTKGPVFDLYLDMQYILN